MLTPQIEQTGRLKTNGFVMHENPSASHLNMPENQTDMCIDRSSAPSEIENLDLHMSGPSTRPSQRQKSTTATSPSPSGTSDTNDKGLSRAPQPIPDHIAQM